MTTELGDRIRFLRKKMGLSLERLAAKSGVALATLSRIENSKGSGTFRTHQRVAEALGLPITELYKGLQESDQEAILTEPRSSEEAPATFTYDENSSAILLTKQISSKKMLPQLIVLKPGGQTSLEQYSPGTERWLFVLEGTVEVAVGDRLYQMTTGNTLYYKASFPHHMSNVGDVPSKIISVTSPMAL